ncbi:MAG: HAMP domain-containing histidine kinase [Campylobacteraceae bacterium]|nr:HAMP domain-containing histidine kinase [Campylobacteraceae bacterium]
MLYNYIKISIFDDVNNTLIREAVSILEQKPFLQHAIGDTKVELVENLNINKSYMFIYFEDDRRYFSSLYYPYDLKSSVYLKLTKDITNTEHLLNKILANIFIVNISAIFLIIFYALLLSSTLLLPIKLLNHKLANMDENFLEEIDTNSLPIEFLPLGKSINRLINRIQTFIKYQKELFIGIAHELKTPLAVMKTKNEVTLIKQREVQKYIEVLKNNNTAINEMNKMISAILEIGRQEGAQFEKLEEMDIIKFLKEKVENFRILAHQENIKIETHLSPKKYTLKTQPTLLTHILQNFIQNAIKFTQENSTLQVKSFEIKNGLTIEVIDEGSGVDENQDFFAPFVRHGNKGGVGLGLFLAKGAADAIGATISLKNRTDNKKGSVATLILTNSRKINIK